MAVFKELQGSAIAAKLSNMEESATLEIAKL